MYILKRKPDINNLRLCKYKIDSKRFFSTDKCSKMHSVQEATLQTASWHCLLDMIRRSLDLDSKKRWSDKLKMGIASFLNFNSSPTSHLLRFDHMHVINVDKENMCQAIKQIVQSMI